MRRSIRILSLFTIWLALITPRVNAEDVQFEKIVVTPYRYEGTLEKTASNISIISPDDIKDSNAKTIIDALRPVSGITIKDYYGNGAASSVDIAGFGEQAALNVLVLIDGRRVNSVDLSGVDWNQIPLDQVEKIEIIRGGFGGVLYGDNASSGVINIITKKGSGKSKIKIQTESGSYAMNKQKISIEGGIAKRFSYLFNIGHDFTHGYRDNTYNKSKDFNLKLNYDITDILSAHFDSGFHASTYGLPGALLQQHIDVHSRTWARYGENHAKNKDYYLLLGGKADFSDKGSFSFDFNYRQKDTDSFFPTNRLDTLKNKIKTFGATPKYTLSHTLADHDNKLIAGLDIYRTLFNSNNYPYSNGATRKNYTNINKNSIGSYLQDEFSLFEQLTLVSGYRYEMARYSFAYHDFTGTNPDRDSKLRPTMSAFNAGLAYNYKDDSSVFFNVSKSFRFPEVDEFTGQNDVLFHQFLNTNLKPQSSINYQVGVRHKFTDSLKTSLSLFRMKVRDYIYYNPTGGVWGFGENENYEKSIHEGTEASFEAKLNKKTSLFLNHTFTKAYFVGGAYAGKEIPMVPHNKASIGLKFLLPKDFTWNIIGNYVGKRFFINDQPNTVPQLNEYMVADTNIAWHHKDLTITFGINNLFNRQYSEYGVYAWVSGATYGQYFYPSPKRNFGLKVDYAF